MYMYHQTRHPTVAGKEPEASGSALSHYVSSPSSALRQKRNAPPKEPTGVAMATIPPPLMRCECGSWFPTQMALENHRLFVCPNTLFRCSFEPLGCSFQVHDYIKMPSSFDIICLFVYCATLFLVVCPLFFSSCL